MSQARERERAAATTERRLLRGTRCALEVASQSALAHSPSLTAAFRVFVMSGGSGSDDADFLLFAVLSACRCVDERICKAA